MPTAHVSTPSSVFPADRMSLQAEPVRHEEVGRLSNVFMCEQFGTCACMAEE